MIKKIAVMLIISLIPLSLAGAAVYKKKITSDKGPFFIYTDDNGVEIAREQISADGTSDFIYGATINGEVKEIDEKGNIIYIWNYSDSKLNGTSYKFYPSGRKMFELIYKDNILRGEAKKYYENGTLSETALYVNGKIEGIAEAYLENGNIYKYLYKGNKLNGESQLFDRQGRILESYTYKDNVLEGPAKQYYLSGVVKSEMEYVRGRLEGYRKYYDEKGREISTSLFRNGREVNKISSFEDKSEGKYKIDADQLSEDGILWKGPAKLYIAESKRMVAEFRFFEKGKFLNGRYKTYYKNGAVHYEGNFVNGTASGKFITYSPEGKIIAVDRFSRGKLSGISYIYYPTGEKFGEYIYKSGELDGVSTTYDKDKKIIMEANYKEGFLHGAVKFFYADGSLRFEAYFSNGEPVGQLRYYFKDEPNKLEYLIEFKRGKINKSTAFSPDGFVEYQESYYSVATRLKPLALKNMNKYVYTE